MDNLRVIQYPHPTLRHVSKPLKRVDAELRDMITRMFELMYQHNGVGLAANQVDLPYRFFLVNLKADPKTGEEMVLLNPVLSRRQGLAEAEEGCLSLPELYAPVKRAEKVVVDAYNLEGQPVRIEADGLMARVVQHETDHIDGRLFIDRPQHDRRTGGAIRCGNSNPNSPMPANEDLSPATPKSRPGLPSWKSCGVNEPRIYAEERGFEEGQRLQARGRRRFRLLSTIMYN